MHAGREYIHELRFFRWTQRRGGAITHARGPDRLAGWCLCVLVAFVLPVSADESNERVLWPTRIWNCIRSRSRYPIFDISERGERVEILGRTPTGSSADGAEQEGGCRAAQMERRSPRQGKRRRFATYCSTTISRGGWSSAFPSVLSSAIPCCRPTGYRLHDNFCRAHVAQSAGDFSTTSLLYAVAAVPDSDTACRH